MTCEERAQELRQLRQSHPHQLVALYRAATGRDELEQLPSDASFMTMMDAIIKQEQELSSGKLQCDPPHAAGPA